MIDPAALAATIAAHKREQLQRLQPMRTDARAHLQELRAQHQDQAAALTDAAEVRELCAGHPFDLFPTPVALADRMVEAAELGPGLSICEPSAGTGWIADAIRRAGRECECIEFNQTLAARLQARGYLVTCTDFLTWRPPGPALFDRFIMNPPFSKAQDVAHVRHAWDLLAPGGIIVAIMSGGGKTQAFIDSLEDIDITSESLPADTFKASGANVNTRLVIIRKRG